MTKKSKNLKITLNVELEFSLKDYRKANDYGPEYSDKDLLSYIQDELEDVVLGHAEFMGSI
jgi:hypothetical protein